MAAVTSGPQITDYGIKKPSISAGEMYSTISVEWAADHFGLS